MFLSRSTGFNTAMYFWITPLLYSFLIRSNTGGLPAPELFPIEDIRIITDDILKTEGAAALLQFVFDAWHKTEFESSRVERYILPDGFL